jgi:hypothetical protein
MMANAIIVGTGAAALLLFAGYLFGVKRGSGARQALLSQNATQAQELERAKEQLAQQRVTTTETLRNDLEKMIQALLRHGDSMQGLLEPLTRRDAELQELRSLVQQVLAPLMQRERLAFELSNLGSQTGDHGGLRQVLDQIAEKGQFWGDLLSNEEGLPLAASSNVKDMERLSVFSSLVSLFADRIARSGGAAPLSLMMHDESNRATLCRIFEVGDQRLLLTAVSTGAQLSPIALDPALAKVDGALLSYRPSP